MKKPDFIFLQANEAEAVVENPRGEIFLKGGGGGRKYKTLWEETQNFYLLSLPLHKCDIDLGHARNSYLAHYIGSLCCSVLCQSFVSLTTELAVSFRSLGFLA